MDQPPSPGLKHSDELIREAEQLLAENPLYQKALADLRVGSSRSEYDDAANSSSKLEHAILRAHRLVSPDLYVIERLKQSGTDPDILALFGDRFDDKVAALIFLAKQKLLDIENSSWQSLDTVDARHDLSAYVEVLFRLKTIDALGIFYDFASAQRDSRIPALWNNVCSHCLYLMALLTDCRAQALAFLADRPEAQRRLKHLSSELRNDIAEVLRNLLEDLLNSGEIATDQQPPAYLAIFRGLEQSGGEGGKGLSSLLTAQDRIEQALEAGDSAGLSKWIATGSPAATRMALNRAYAILPTDDYLDILANVLKNTELEPVRRAALIMELGNINRTQHLNGGLPRINRMLAAMAMTEHEEMAEMASIAVRELAKVKALTDLGSIIQKSPLLPPAIEALKQLKELRQLPTSQAFVDHRPELVATYKEARQELNNLTQIVHSAYSCPTDDIAQIYLSQLVQANALPELRQLANGQTHVAEMAQRLIYEMENPE